MSSTHTRSGRDALGKHGTSGVPAYFCTRNLRQKYRTRLLSASGSSVSHILLLLKGKENQRPFKW